MLALLLCRPTISFATVVTVAGKILTVISKSLALLYAAAADNLLQSYLVLLDLMLLIRLSGNGLQPGHF